MSTKYIRNNYGITTPPGPELLTFPCVTHDISWLLSQKMWQPVTLKVGFLPYTKVQYVIYESNGAFYSQSGHYSQLESQ